jgi:peptidoglycan hydrolase-like protein with peptidoglycan-binding domain
VLRRRKNVRLAVAALAGVVLLAAIGSLAARRIRSPAQIAADTAPPAASRISVPVERRALATEVIVRGTVRYGAPQEVTLPVSALKTSTSVVSRVPKPETKLDEADKALVISGRPVFVFRGATPMHRDLQPGSEGKDVRQLEQALARGGFNPGSIDGRYDGATAAAVASMYVKYNEAPFGPTDVQGDQLRTAAASAAAARDAALQTRLALRTAKQGATPADRNQARLDAVAAAEQIPVARTAITAARDKASAARAAIRAAELQNVEAGSTAGREIALADADVVTKRAAVNDALEAQAEAQRQLASAAPDITPDELETLRAAVRTATGRSPSRRPTSARRSGRRRRPGRRLRSRPRRRRTTVSSPPASSRWPRPTPATPARRWSSPGTSATWRGRASASSA